jgi:hypothetical protein
MISFLALSSSRGISVRIKPVAIISLILIICIYLVLRADPAYQVIREEADGETTIQGNNPSDSSSTSSQVTAELKQEQADSSMTGIDSLTTPTDSDATDVIIIGSYKDPDDSNQFEREDREPISIGVVLDADNEEGWPPRESVIPIASGDVLDASALGYQDSAAEKEAISIGAPLDVERFLAGEYADSTDQDRTPISIGEKIDVPK